MRRLMGSLLALVVAVGPLSLGLSPSAAQNWPQKPIRMIVPFPPGGGTDFMGRLVAKHLSQRLGQMIFVENRGGANGTIGLQALMKSNPDGYTIATTSDTPLTVNPLLYKNLPYQPLRDFVLVATVVRSAEMLAVHPSVPAHSVAELIALAKEKPGSLSFGTGGIGNFSHLAMELFSLETGVKLLHVPYKGTGPAAMALIGGDVQMGFIPVQTLLPYVKSGQLIALAVGEPQRMPSLPDLPTVAETLPGFDTAAWEGIIVPAGTPKEIVTRLREATLSIMHDPVIAKQFTDQQKIVMALGPDEFADLVRKDSAKWEKVIKAAHIKVE
jgi:tripartite-type tricarboxylate transporter receptor subunit TctC